jgi:hypothetical protein
MYNYVVGDLIKASSLHSMYGWSQILFVHSNPLFTNFVYWLVHELNGDLGQKPASLHVRRRHGATPVLPSTYSTRYVASRQLVNRVYSSTKALFIAVVLVVGVFLSLMLVEHNWPEHYWFLGEQMSGMSSF